MPTNQVVSHEQWLAARTELLEKEKEFTKLRDEITAQQRNLPWEKVEKDYTYRGAEGEVSLADLFAGRSQLIVYHFMFDPSWDEGCKSCSMIADHYDRIIVHLNARDVTFVTVSRAPLDKLLAFRQRMGWEFEWVSSLESDFNWDFNVSFTPEQLETGEVYYNYRKGKEFPVAEAPGISVFYQDENGDIFHTYSVFARGLDLFLGVYNFLDIVPKGRDEESLQYGMEWVRHHDRYGDESFVDPYVQLDVGDAT